MAHAIRPCRVYQFDKTMPDRTSIPLPLARAVKVEAGHRCAIPTCKKYPIELHHIIPYEKCKDHTFDNLIVLCTECHARYHRTKEIDVQALKMYKANLGLLQHRYGETEQRILQSFCDQPENTSIRLAGPSEISVLFLLKDGLLAKAGNSGVFSSGVPTWEAYSLTDKGKSFLENWKQAQPIE